MLGNRWKFWVVVVCGDDGFVGARLWAYGGGQTRTPPTRLSQWIVGGIAPLPDCALELTVAVHPRRLKRIPVVHAGTNPDRATATGMLQDQ